MNGYEENPDVSTVATGSFDARACPTTDTSIHYELSYSGLEGTVTQSHVHFGKAAVNGGISFFLCGTAGPARRPSGDAGRVRRAARSTDDIDAADVHRARRHRESRRANLAEILAAMRAGHAYANVHSTKCPGGEIRAQLDERVATTTVTTDDDDD